MSKFTTFKGKRGNFSVAVDGETWNISAIVFGLEKADPFGVQHEEPISWRLDEKNHSPTGLEWGYGGSGPAQLAYCLLRECGLTKPQANKLYQQFKADVVAQMNHGGGFEITKEQILEWVKNPAPAPESVLTCKR